MRVVLSSGNPLARQGIAGLLADDHEMEVVAQVSPDEAAEATLDAGADVLVLDIGIADADSLESAGAIGRALADVPLVALVSPPGEVRAAFAAGAAGVLSGDTDAVALAGALRAAVAGLAVLTRADVASLAGGGSGRGPADLPVEALTARELDVLQLLASGMTTPRMAHALEISEHTIKFHVTSILGKLGASTRAEAVARAAGLGLILV